VTQPHPKLRIAEHEAAHAVAALAMGLTVAWVSIDQVTGKDDIYGAATGIAIEGDDESDMMKLAVDHDIVDERTLFNVCVSMAMPAHIAMPDGHWLVDYSRDEANQAFWKASAKGISSDEIADQCQIIWEERWWEIASLAQRLCEEGRVELATV
jgi:hypothetical protein